MSEYETTVRALFHAIEDGVIGDGLRIYYTADAEQIEYPSLMRPHGGSRDLAGMLAGSEIGATLIAGQRYDDVTVIDDGERIAARFTWRGTLLVDAGEIAAGTELVAHIAAFFEFRDGLIARQASYDCYQPVG